MAQKEYVISVLKQLAFKIKNEIDESLSQNLIQPDEETYHHWKVTKFQYTDKGVTDFAASGEHVNKKVWYRALSKIEESIKKSEEYSSALEIETLDKSKVDRFVGKIVTHRLYEERLDETDIDTFIANFLKDLSDEPLRHGAHVELDGIVMQPERIEFSVGDTDIVLRQTRIEDLEKEFPIYGFGQPFQPNPSAILDVDFLGRYVNEIQTKVEQAVAILRLFKVGSVRYISYSMHSESITQRGFGGITAGQHTGPSDKSLITEQDSQRLKGFWQTMIKALPQSFYEIGETRVDHLLIAYKRYCDALLLDGVLERRIANAVMGLESLFLKGSEAQELTYRLSMRIAKTFSLLGYNAHAIKEVIEDGYGIRSLFVHGSHLSYARNRKLTDKYGDTTSFLLLLLDYLRISIILMIFIKRKKEEFLDIIDDSLVDMDKDNQLNNLLSTARNFI